MAVPAVQKVVPDVPHKRGRVLYDPQKVSEDRLRQRVEEMGYL